MAPAPRTTTPARESPHHHEQHNQFVNVGHIRVPKRRLNIPANRDDDRRHKDKGGGGHCRMAPDPMVGNAEVHRADPTKGSSRSSRSSRPSWLKVSHPVSRTVRHLQAAVLFRRSITQARIRSAI